MNYGWINNKDVVNGIGFGVSLFVSGCRGYCKGCFNQETWDFNYGKKFTDDTMNEILSLLDRPYVNFFSVLGGEPLEPENRDEVLNIIKTVKSSFPNLRVNIWSRFLYEESIKDKTCKEILDLCDELVDGEFILEKKSLSLVQRGSSNQRIIDLNETRRQGVLVLNKELMKIK